MMDTDSIAQLNNNAVALFQRGCFEEAVVNLTAAINRLVWSMQDDPRDQRGVITSYQSCDVDVRPKVALTQSQVETLKQPSCIQHPWSGMLLPVAVEQPVAATGEAYTESAMYSRALMLSEVFLDSSSDHFMMRASVSMLYNLAFLHHWRAIHLGMSSGMLKALQMYCKILKTFHSRRDNPPDIEIVVLAVWNNMGHIYSQLFQVEEARACFDHLRHLLASRTDLHFWIPDQDYEIFVVSALFQGNSLHLAPAA